MNRRVRLMAIALVVPLAMAGCPWPAGYDGPRLPGGETAGTGSPTGGGGGGSGSGSSQSGQSSQGSSAIAGQGAGSANSFPGSWDSYTVEYPGCQEPTQGAYWREEVLRLVNVERAREGLGSVTYNATLADQAATYACEMIYHDFFAHVNPVTGSHLVDRTRDAGYEFWIVGENLAAGQRTAVEAVAAWMDSPEHRENILNPQFTELGVAVRVGGDYGIYWVQEFGRPASAGAYQSP